MYCDICKREKNLLSNFIVARNHSGEISKDVCYDCYEILIDRIHKFITESEAGK